MCNYSGYWAKPFVSKPNFYSECSLWINISRHFRVTPVEWKSVVFFLSLYSSVCVCVCGALRRLRGSALPRYQTLCLDLGHASPPWSSNLQRQHPLKYIYTHTHPHTTHSYTPNEFPWDCVSPVRTCGCLETGPGAKQSHTLFFTLLASLHF